MSQEDAYIATTRFGLGASPGDLYRGISAETWLKTQLNSRADESQKFYHDFPTSQEMLNSYFLAESGQAEFTVGEFHVAARAVLSTHQEAQMRLAIVSDSPFYERLVWFWINHFAVSAQKQDCTGLVSSFEIEAIRPNMFGSFDDMVQSVARHPAMLTYLDNRDSVGPNSPKGLEYNMGLNENYARELLELHTVGVNGGYGQEDVESLAKILTGWGIDKPTASFGFDIDKHEPGTHEVMGTSYGQYGEGQGTAAIRDLASHPSTARFIATKLVRHFIADNPPASAVAAIEDEFIRTNGNLKAIYEKLVEIPESWSLDYQKFKLPQEFIISAIRALGTRGHTAEEMYIIISLLRHMNHLPFDFMAPTGFSDRIEDWSGPEALVRRLIEASAYMGSAIKLEMPVDEVASGVLGPVLGGSTMDAIRSSSSDKMAIISLLSSPEFQRR